ASLPGLRGASVGRAVWQTEHDNAPRAFEHVPRMLVGVLSSRDVIHLSCVAAIKPLGEARNARGSNGGANADVREAEAASRGLQRSRYVSCRCCRLYRGGHKSGDKQPVGNAVGECGLLTADFDGDCARLDSI